jgi:hypothetical protein
MKRQETAKFCTTLSNTVRQTDRIGSNLVAWCRATQRTQKSLKQTFNVQQQTRDRFLQDKVLQGGISTQKLHYTFLRVIKTTIGDFKVF